MRRLDGWRFLNDVCESDGRTGKPRVATPGRGENVDVLVGEGASIRQVDTERRQLGTNIPGADADHYPTLAQHVDAGELFSEQNGLPLGEHEDTDTKSDSICDRSEKGEGDQRLETWLCRRIRRVVGERDVVTHPKRLETARLCQLRQVG